MTLNHPYNFYQRNQDQDQTTAPAAGAAITYTNAEGNRIEILTFDFSLVTSATVADREVRIELTYATITSIIARSPSIQQASATKYYTVQSGSSNYVDSGGQHNIISLPNRLCIPYGGTLRATAYNLQAGDQFSASKLIFLAFKELT